MNTAGDDFWSTFLSRTGEPAVVTTSTSEKRGPSAEDTQPVYLRYADDVGFENAAQLDLNKLTPGGDVLVSVNTSIVKAGDRDRKTFSRLQNAQLRVDVVQKTPLIPVQFFEPMAYTVVAVMSSVRAGSKSAPAASKEPSTVQNISMSSDAQWQKMQKIPLKLGAGRWTLNLEGQKKDSIFGRMLQVLVKDVGIFRPMIGLVGIAVSALQSFNEFYQALHKEPVSIIKSPPVEVFATQEALEKTGSPGSVNGVHLRSGTYILMPAGQAPSVEELNKNAIVLQGRVVAKETNKKALPNELDEAATDLSTLRNVSYVTFDVGVEPTTMFEGTTDKKAG